MIRMTTNKGVIEIELNAEKAPLTVENFLTYVNEGFYDRTIFHRVVENFMIDGGCYEPGMKVKYATHAAIKNEADNGLKNERGSIAMLYPMVPLRPHGATSVFGFNIVDNDFLNFSSPSDNGWGHCVFGKITKGLEVIDKIKGGATKNISATSQDVPVEDIIIEKIDVLD